MSPSHDTSPLGLSSFIKQGHLKKARGLLKGPSAREAAAGRGADRYRPTALFHLFDARRLALLPLLIKQVSTWRRAMRKGTPP